MDGPPRVVVVAPSTNFYEANGRNRHACVQRMKANPTFRQSVDVVAKANLVLYGWFFLVLLCVDVCAKANASQAKFIYLAF
jgi:hypothetical protein